MGLIRDSLPNHLFFPPKPHPSNRTYARQTALIFIARSNLSRGALSHTAELGQ